MKTDLCIVHKNPPYGFYDIILQNLSLDVDSVTLAGHGQCPLTLPKIREPGSNFCFPILINLKNINFIQKSTQNALVVLFTAKPRAKQPNFLPEISRSYTMNITVILYQ